MKKALSIVALIAASVLIAQAEVVTVKGTLERSKGGSRTLVLRNPSISVMEKTLFTEPSLQAQLEPYEGKEVQITGEIYKRPAGYSAIKSIEKITVIGGDTEE